MPPPLLKRGFGWMANVKKVYWDSCTWLGLLNRESNRLIEIEYIWKQAEQGGVEIWTSTVAQMEVCKLASERDAISVQGNSAKTKIMTENNLNKIENLFNQPFVKRIPLDVEISSRARRLFRETDGLDKVADAAHVISAMKWNIPTIHTYDGTDLLHLSGKLFTDDGTEIEICEPSERPPKDLFSPKDENDG